MIGIIDYNAGNIKSVERALAACGIPCIRAKKPAELADCERLIFPGVGDAAFAMAQLKETGFDSFIKDRFAAGTPLMGICLGSQIIFDFSEEGDVPCLGLIPGRIRHFEALFHEAGIDHAERGLKIPHMGWNNLTVGEDAAGTIMKEVNTSADFYFVHSYVIQPENAGDIAATADYGIAVPSIIKHGNLVATQFHPEKSGVAGLQILKNFCSSDATGGFGPAGAVSGGASC